MKNIYFGHSKDIDYQELYLQLEEIDKKSNLNFILPHKLNEYNENAREFYKTIDLFIAEVSLPATGLGIELGWVYDDNIPIVAIYKNGSKVSNSIKSVTNVFIVYEDINDFKNKIMDIIKNI